ncbi:MAG: DUF3120 domain-containing protein [Cyanobacteria bacterium J06632_3]
MQISNDQFPDHQFSDKTSSQIPVTSALRTVTDPQRAFSLREIFQSPASVLSEPRVKAFAAAAFLVAVPVFIQAPLVRVAPTLSLLLTAAWLLLGWSFLRKSQHNSAVHLSAESSMPLWGDLVIGFSWTWMAGAIYWGWFRWDPYVHLPIESVGLPIVIALLWYGKAKIGNYFYLGSLLGTAITDLYFYCVGLIPYWRALMVEPPESAPAILHGALLRMETYQGVGSAIVLLTLLVMLGTIPLRSTDVKWWAFSGAVLSTILVDSLFFVAAVLA